MPIGFAIRANLSTWATHRSCALYQLEKIPGRCQLPLVWRLLRLFIGGILKLGLTNKAVANLLTWKTPRLLFFSFSFCFVFFFQVFNCRSVDHDVGLGYLCSIPKQTAFQYLVSGTNFLGQSCAKILVRREIGRPYSVLN